MSEEIRDQILEAVVEPFAAHGFDGASTRALAGAARVNISTLAYHFRDKQGLYDATINRIYQRIAAIDLTVPVGTQEEQVRSVVRRAYAFARVHRSEIRILLHHLVATRHLPSAVRQRWLGPLVAKAAALTDALQLPPKDYRLPLLSLQHLIVRYAISEAEDLALTTEAVDPHEAATAHIADVAVSILL